MKVVLCLAVLLLAQNSFSRSFVVAPAQTKVDAQVKLVTLPPVPAGTTCEAFAKTEIGKHFSKC